jgi:hypothetical protein
MRRSDSHHQPAREVALNPSDPVDPDDVEIVCRDGKKHVLGSGSCGQVRFGISSRTVMAAGHVMYYISI